MRSSSVPVNAAKENPKILQKGVSKRKLSELYDMIDSIYVEEKPKLQLIMIGAPNQSKIAKDFQDA